MATQKKVAKTFDGLRYRELQALNATRRRQLAPEDQRWLKQNGYRNVGWEAVISLHQKISDLLDRAKLEDLSLEELFLEADRIGNKYLTPEEIQDFNQQLAQEVAEIGDLIDQQFPDTEVEAIDYGQNRRKSPKQRNQKTYRTIRIE